jgi:hypothetical protein
MKNYLFPQPTAVLCKLPQDDLDTGLGGPKTQPKLQDHDGAMSRESSRGVAMAIPDV